MIAARAPSATRPNLSSFVLAELNSSARRRTRCARAHKVRSRRPSSHVEIRVRACARWPRARALAANDDDALQQQRAPQRARKPSSRPLARRRARASPDHCARASLEAAKSAPLASLPARQRPRPAPPRGRARSTGARKAKNTRNGRTRPPRARAFVDRRPSNGLAAAHHTISSQNRDVC